jgi:hypothetical protein
MKKIIACISLVFALSAGATALAAEVGDTSYSVDATGKNTILIQAANDSIVYADQNDSGFGAAVNCLFTTELAEGTYTVKMNTFEGDASSTTFTVVAPGKEEADGTEEVSMTANESKIVDHGTVKSVLFETNKLVDSNKPYNAVKITYGGQTATLRFDNSMTHVTGESYSDISVFLVELPTSVDVSAVSVALVVAE